MKARQQRMIFIGVVAVAMLVSLAFAYKAFNENLLYYYDPSDIAAGEAPVDRGFRLGGMVVEGSVQRAPGSLTASFDVTDYAETVAVEYTGVLPNLFAEGQGVVVHGSFDDTGLFVADRVLAKHDENYMAPEVAESLADAAERAGE
jgi:cytochrome c-type biogenesis protein CcmE